MAVKTATTYAFQIQKLKSRGCTFPDETEAADILARINYYRLSAYFLPFRKPDGTYLSGTDFSTVYDIYEFDRKYRRLVFSVIEEIEVYLRSQISYYFAHKYGSLGYLDPSHFTARHNNQKFQNDIQKTIQKNRSRPFVQHHINNYNGQFPFWVIVELMTFGNLSVFYADMLTADKKAFSSYVFGLHYDVLESWLYCLTDLRNYCAHYARLYYTRMRAIPQTPHEFPMRLSRTIFDYLLVLKRMYPDKEKWNQEFLEELNTLVKQFTGSINLSHLNFPADWYNQLKK